MPDYVSAKTSMSAFLRSPEAGIYVALAGLILGVVSFVAALVPLLEGTNEQRVAWLAVACIALVCVVMVFMFVLFKVGHEDLLRHDEIVKSAEQRYGLLLKSLDDKEKLIEAQEAASLQAVERREKTAFLYREINRERARYSGILKLIQELILKAPVNEEGRRFFPHSERRTREALEDFCDRLQSIVEVDSPHEYSVNIKLVKLIEMPRVTWDREQYLKTSGIPLEESVPAEKIAYKTVARSQQSRGRGDNRNEDKMTLNDHLLLRNLWESQSEEVLLIQDMDAYLVKHRRLVDRKLIAPFIYPDNESVTLYQSTLVTPIITSFDTPIIEGRDRIRLVTHQLYGFLAVDAASRNAFKNKALATDTCKEAAAIVMSILHEYGRCISHLEYRFGGDKA